MTSAPAPAPAPANLVLIGMPAVGKSTVGVLLAKQVGFSFVDTDLLIQQRAGASLERIIAAGGIERFCDLEEQVIVSLAGRRQVIATGGSVVYRHRAMAHLSRLGRIVWLDIDAGRLVRRLDDMDGRGVVRRAGQSIAELDAERRPLYRRWAQVTVDTTGLAPHQVARAVLAALAGDALATLFL